MDKVLKKLTIEYINKVDEVSKIIYQGLNLKSKEDFAITHRRLGQYGEFEFYGTNKYFFHGRGCRFENNQIKIDWDFGFRDHFCGLDPYKVSVFIKEYYKDLVKCHDFKYIEQEFGKAVLFGEMKKIGGLYYFSVRGQNLLRQK